MAETVYEAIVVGVGAMGSAALYQLAKRGKRVLGIDQFAPPHTLGSSHGDTRITRQAVGEGAAYVPLVMRSHELWREIEAQTGDDLYTVTGGLIIGREHQQTRHHGKENFVQQTIKLASQFQIAHEVLRVAEIKRRFPPFNLHGDEIGYYEPLAGFLRPENCIRAQLKLAERFGATLQTNTKVQGIEVTNNGLCTVITSQGRFTAEKVIISAGAWVKDFLGAEYANFINIYRQVLYWFDVSANYAAFTPEVCPIYIWMFGEADDEYLYGFPAIDGVQGGLKIAAEQMETSTDPDTVSRTVTAEETDAMYRRYVAPQFPSVSNQCVKAATCFYTVTPGSRFIIDQHPAHPQVIVASPCSGHGFKHSAAIGEVLADLVTTGSSKIDLAPFSFAQVIGTPTQSA
ncbi:MAG: N-methyl-L-tryptophan oxidase [Anaerolineae bacterium]|nr:N-methyl-L-tryptophan oxidase [Anaerolineae bacterium]